MKGIKMEVKNVTANSAEELSKKVQEIIAQGWEADGSPVKNTNGTWTQKMIKKK